MVLTHDQKMEAIADVSKAAKLCRMHGLVGWDVKLTYVLVPRIRHWDGPTCADMQASLRNREVVSGVETFETMLCNELCTYIDRMPLDKSRMAERIQPFEYLNHVDMHYLKEIELSVAKLLFAGTYEGRELFLKAGVPLEYLHTQLRAYDNKARLLGFILRVDDNADFNAKVSEIGKNIKKHEEYQELVERGETLYEQYRTYSDAEVDRVARHYGKTCLNAEYPPSPAPVQQ